MNVRVVATGHDASGKAVFVSDTEVAPVTLDLMPGAEFHRLWGGDETSRFPDDGALPAHETIFPPVGGFRFLLFTVPPSGAPAAPPVADPESARAQLEAALPGAMAYMEPDAPGMHTTDTIDFEIVLEGEVWLELDDGVEVGFQVSDHARWMELLQARVADRG